MAERVKQAAADTEIVDLIERLLITGIADRDSRPAPELIFSEGLDWTHFLQVAASQRVAPLLHDLVKGRQLLPPAVEQQLEVSYLANARRNLVLLHELQLALDRLQAAGIDTIVLKGAALAETVYKNNFALRAMGDLDILVAANQAALTRQVFSELGYGYETEARPGANITYENEVALFKPCSEPYLLEVHWSLFNSPFYQQLPSDWYWESATQIETSSGKMRILCPEAQILYYAGHMVLHHGREWHLLWLFDMARLIQVQGDELDWQLILDRAKDLHLILPLKQTLHTLAADWSVPIPGEILQQLQRIEPSREEAAVFAALTAKHRPVPHRFLWDLRTMPGWRERAHYAWISLFPAPAYMYERHGFSSPAYLPIFYLYRLYLGARATLAYLFQKLSIRRQTP